MEEADFLGFPRELRARYQPQRRLGEGSYGTVWAAQDLRLNRVVAVKLLAESRARGIDQRARERFLREAQMLSGFRHPNLLEVLDFGVAEGVPFQIQTLIEGPDLARYFRQSQGKIAPGDLLSIALDLASALAECHAHEVIHRDVKPANLLLGVEGKAVLMDFGLGRTPDSVSLTKTGRIVGSPLYMSPQQLCGDPPSPDQDVYAAGLVLLEGARGRVPGRGLSIQELYETRLQGYREELEGVASAWGKA